MNRVAQFGAYLIRKPMFAAMTACVFALFPLVSLLNHVLVGLFTFSRGVWSGFKLILWALLPAIALAVVGVWMPLLYLGSVNILVWLSALFLNRFDRLSSLLELYVLMGLILVALVHVCVPDVAHVWLLWLQKILAQTAAEQSIASPVAQSLGFFSEILTGFFFASVLVLIFVYVQLSKMWFLSTEQKKRPGFLRGIRISRGLSVLLIVDLILGYGFQLSLAKDCAPVALMPFVLSGLSYYHDGFCGKKYAIYMLSALYVGFALIFPYVAALFVVTGIIDSWVDLRQRFFMINK